MTNYKHLCAELVEIWDATADFDYNDFGNAAADLVVRARAALAEPEPERLTVAQIKALPDNGENFIWEDPRGTGWIDLDGTFSRDDLQQLANSLPIATTRSENV